MDRDIIERLRDSQPEGSTGGLLLNDAADEIRELRDEGKTFRKALENIIIWAKGSTCEICGEKKMINTDAYYYAKEALLKEES